MSIISKTALILGTAVIAAYGVGQFTAASILTVIEIQAPPEAVWAELTSTENYTDWNPFITQMSGELIEGQRLGATLQLEGKVPMKIAPKVLVASENRELRWLGRTGFRGIFDGEHYFVLEESEQGTTVLQHGEDFSGMLTHIVFALVGQATEEGFQAMNQALKHRVETKL